VLPTCGSSLSFELAVGTRGAGAPFTILVASKGDDGWSLRPSKDVTQTLLGGAVFPTLSALVVQARRAGKLVHALHPFDEMCVMGGERVPVGGAAAATALESPFRAAATTGLGPAGSNYVDSLTSELVLGGDAPAGAPARDADSSDSEDDAPRAGPGGAVGT